MRTAAPNKVVDGELQRLRLALKESQRCISAALREQKRQQRARALLVRRRARARWCRDVWDRYERQGESAATIARVVSRSREAIRRVLVKQWLAQGAPLQTRWAREHPEKAHYYSMLQGLIQRARERAERDVADLT